jgi:uncharacterized protein DUF4339
MDGLLLKRTALLQAKLKVLEDQKDSLTDHAEILAFHRLKKDFNTVLSNHRDDLPPDPLQAVMEDFEKDKHLIDKLHEITAKARLYSVTLAHEHRASITKDFLEMLTDWLPSQKESLEKELSAVHSRFSHEYWDGESNELQPDAKVIAEFLGDDVLSASDTKDWIALSKLQGPRYEALLAALENIDTYIKNNVLYVMHDGQRQGPFLLDELDKLLERGAITESDLVWHHSIAEWTPLSELFQMLLDRKVVNTPNKFDRFLNGMLQKRLVYLTRANERLGPFVLDNLRTLVLEGVVMETDLAWHNAVTEWLPVAELLTVLEGRNILPPPSRLLRLKRWMQKTLSKNRVFRLNSRNQQ